jgi:membrane-associated phospholipid phosphatase
LGQIDSRDRSSQQTDITRFWIGSAETGTFVGLWNQSAARLTVQQQVQQQASTQSNLEADSLLQTAGRFAQLNLALADAGIAAWDAKYAYRSWRPITAIRLAGSDHNPATKADPAWQSYLETPAHPDYVSGHSTFSGAAAAVLTQSFGLQPFSVTSLDLPGASHRFESFRQAASEAGMSRIYGGIHTMSANRAGQQLGRNIANFVLQQFDAVN